MKKLKKYTTRLLSLTLAAVMSLSVGISASAKPAYQWGMDFSFDDPEDCYGWYEYGKTKFSVDSKVHTDNSWYSIKLENTDYAEGCVEKTYDVEPYTTYKFSAMVKYSGYQPDPDEKGEESGACIGEAFYYDPQTKYYRIPFGKSDYTASSDWTLLEYEFTTGSETAHGLRLGNIKCKGTAWFTDIKLEKAEMTNSWNILAVFFKNVDATVSLNGEQVRHKMSLRDSDIEGMNRYALDTLPSNLKDLSDNRMSVNSIDRYYVDETLTEEGLTARGDGYYIEPDKSSLVSETLDRYLAQKHYNQIIIFVPFHGITGDWWGLGGSTYKGVYFAQVTNSWEGAFEKDDRFKGEVTVHEICHGLEYSSMDLNAEKTPNFHSVIYDYPDPDVSLYERIHKFMTATLPGGKGLDPSVFNVTSGNYTLVSDDMTTGAGIEPGSSSVTPPAPDNLIVESSEDDTVKVSWDAPAKAVGYQLALFKAADFKEVWKTFDYGSDRTSTTLAPITKGKPYYYGIRAMYTQGGSIFYSEWNTRKFIHAAVGVVYGDVDNNGKFELSDIVAVLQDYVNNRPADQRTLDAVCAAEKGRIELDDISMLLKNYVNS